MGCSTSNEYALVYSKNEKLASWKQQFDILCLTERDIGRLFRIFRRVDVDNSGQIELAELLVHMDVEKTPFTRRVFSIFDEDGSGMHYLELLISIILCFMH